MNTHDEFRLAIDPDTSKEILDTLSRNSSEKIRGAVALNPSAGQKTLLHLVGDSSSHVAENLANNKQKFSINNFEVSVCKHTKLRLASIQDAEFILSLRLDSNLNKYVNPTDNDISKQKHWQRKYEEREKSRTEFYFIITSLSNSALGTVRVYDIKGDSFCWGSWIIKPNAPAYTSIESALSIYEFAFYQLGFQRSHFDIRKENVRVIKFHEGFGARQTSSDADNYYYNFEKSDYEVTKNRYKKFFAPEIICY